MFQLLNLTVWRISSRFCLVQRWPAACRLQTGVKLKCVSSMSLQICINAPLISALFQSIWWWGASSKSLSTLWETLWQKYGKIMQPLWDICQWLTGSFETRNILWVNPDLHCEFGAFRYNSHMIRRLHWSVYNFWMKFREKCTYTN